MIGTGTKVAIALGAAALGALGVAVGIASASTSAPKPSPAPSPPHPPKPGPVLPPAGNVTWTIAPSQIVQGTRTRVSVSAADLAVLAQSIGTTADYNGWLDILSNPVVQSALQSTTLSVWGPNPSGDGTMYPSPLPADWPSDDTNASTEFHAEFIYGGAQPLQLSAFPIPLLAWVAVPH